MADFFLMARYAAVLEVFPASGPGVAMRMMGIMAIAPMIKMSTFMDCNFGQ
jgi:hypothetical protein